MAVVKISNKELLEQLQAKITLKIGKKPTQQELLDLCIHLGLENIDILISRLNSPPILDADKVKRILARRDKRQNIPYNTDLEGISVDDQEIYKSTSDED